ncbi:MAG: 50S ribosomal protein L10 [Candidatus Omnitrophica bacterium]|nr:50S ribosomal protein L10 [Candidatus Omnitrophota bacterium]
MKKVGQLIREGIADKIRQNVKDHGTTFLVSYTKMSSPKMNNFRKVLSAVGAKVYVSKNRIAQKALQSLEFEQMSEKIKNQIAFVWSNKDSSEVAKVLMRLTKDVEGLNVQGGVLDGKAVEQADVKRLSDLPSREVLLTMLAQTIQSPLVRLAGALSGKTRDLIYILKQLSEKSAPNSPSDKSS